MSTTRQRNHQSGILAEYMACALLMLKGYHFVAMRYKTPVGEVDLIMRRGRTLAIIEVKARVDHIIAAAAIHSQNQSRVLRASQYFLVSHPQYTSLQVRFDAVLVAWYRWPHHIPHAFAG